jgi:hypothetical protein
VTRETGHNVTTGGTTTVLEKAVAPARATQLKRRRWWGASIAAVVATGIAVGTVIAIQPDDPVRVVQTPDPRSSPPAPWMSGASGQGVTSGEFAEWRGRPVDISATWADNNEAMVALHQLRPDGEFGDWDLPLDIAIGALDEGETWGEAADGEYDARWRESLRNLRELRADRPGTTYIRFAHEMNGNWYPWAVTADDHQAFVEAWRRFRGLQQRIFPEAQLVFCVNRESVDTGMDWREFFPGRRYVDVMAVDYYNMNPSVDSAEEWQKAVVETDDWGGPKGLHQHRDFARSVGLPLAVPEWSGNADEGDSPAYIRGMHEFFDRYGGDGAGQLLYEIQFNMDKDERRWLLFDEYTRMPISAETYQELW